MIFRCPAADTSPDTWMVYARIQAGRVLFNFLVPFFVAAYSGTKAVAARANQER